MTGEILEVQREPENEHNHRAVCLLKSDMIVGQVPREFSGSFWDVVEEYLVKLL